MSNHDLLFSLVFLYTLQKLLSVASPAVDPWRLPRRSPARVNTASDLDTLPVGATTWGGQERVGPARLAPASAAGSRALSRAGGRPFTGAAQRTLARPHCPAPARGAGERARDPQSAARPVPAAGRARGRRGGGKRARPRRRRGGRDWRRHGDNAPDRLLIGQLNVQSLKPKIADLRADLPVYQFDVLALCETWLQPNVPNRLLNIDGYRLYRCDRPANCGLAKGHGGVALLIRDSCKVEVLKTPVTGVLNSNLEVLWSKIIVGK